MPPQILLSEEETRPARRAWLDRLIELFSFGLLIGVFGSVIAGFILLSLHQTGYLVLAGLVSGAASYIVFQFVRR